jgi:hypothetical protein
MENVAKFKYLETTGTNKKEIHEEINSRLSSVDSAFCHSAQNLVSSRLSCL